MESIRVLLVDDQQIVRQGLSTIKYAAGIEVVAQADNGHEGIALAQDLRPDNGQELCERHDRQAPGQRPDARRGYRSPAGSGGAIGIC
jgi:CheY-like chemotaxis protein